MRNKKSETNQDSKLPPKCSYTKHQSAFARIELEIKQRAEERRKIREEKLARGENISAGRPKKYSNDKERAESEREQQRRFREKQSKTQVLKNLMI